MLARKFYGKGTQFIAYYRLHKNLFMKGMQKSSPNM